MESSLLRIATWNVMWARPATRRGNLVRTAMESLNADILCVTEGSAGLLPTSGHVIEADGDFGYKRARDERKLLLWSRTPWSDVDRVGDAQLPSGRFVAGTTATPLGVIRIVGSCIPWWTAHVSTGQKNRRPWEDHLAYLRAMPAIFDSLPPLPAVWLGDFNQPVPAMRAPAEAKAAMDALCERWVVTTRGATGSEGQGLIDHIAHSEELLSVKLSILPRSADNLKLSDHDGVLAVIRLT